MSSFHFHRTTVVPTPSIRKVVVTSHGTGILEGLGWGALIGAGTGLLAGAIAYLIHVGSGARKEINKRLPLTLTIRGIPPTFILTFPNAFQVHPFRRQVTLHGECNRA